VSTSPLYNRVDTLAVIAGYSMGGACAVVAATQQPSFDCLITLAAAAYLYSSSTTLAASVIVPSITFSGTADVIASPSNQIGIYNNLASQYKSFVSFTGQGHDSFYNNPQLPVILNPWFSYLKTGSVYYIDQYESVLGNYPASVLTWQHVNNLVINLDQPERVALSTTSGVIQLSWDSIQEAHSYKVYASTQPFSGFTDVTSQGTFISSGRISWTAAAIPGNTAFYQVRACRQ
jgi:hypothetical protein